MNTKSIKIAAIALSVLLGLLFLSSASMKLAGGETATEAAASVGLSASTYFGIGILELAFLALFLIPRTGVIGTLLMAAYMGGAIVTHLEHGQPIAMALGVEILLCATALLRFPELRERVLGKLSLQRVK